MAAMFKAQTENWEETQEKMSQLVSPIVDFVCVVVLVLMIIISSCTTLFLDFEQCNAGIQ
jgi:hypothetical protein